MFEGEWTVWYKAEDNPPHYWEWKAIDEKELYCFQGSKYVTRAAAKRGWKAFSRRLGIDRYIEVVL